MAAENVTLPDLLANWPWKRELNPHYDVVRAETASWLHGFGLFDAASEDAFDRCELCELPSEAQVYIGHQVQENADNSHADLCRSSIGHAYVPIHEQR